MPEGAATGGVTGMGAGAILGWLAGIGTLIRGPFPGGPPAGGLGARGWGDGHSQYKKRYEGKRGQRTEVTPNSDQEKVAKDIYKRAGAEDISSTSEASVS